MLGAFGQKITKHAVLQQIMETIEIKNTNAAFKPIGVLRKELPKDAVYECTNDMQYLQQYFFIREYAYRLDLGLKKFTGVEDAIDQYSHFIIARKGDFCLGGGRLTISTKTNPVKLPLESENFTIPQILPEVAESNYCEFGRTALLPEYRTGDTLKNIFRKASDISLRFDCKYMVGVSPPSVARRFRKVFESIGYRAWIREDIKFPTKAIHEHLSLQLIVGIME